MPSHPIEVRDLAVAYDGKIAIERIDHTFASASSTAVMGANGSGKTTLLNALAGLVSPLNGTISGVEPGDIGYVMQHGSGTWMPITVGEVVEMGRYRQSGLFGRLRAEDRAAIVTAAERLAITDLMARQFHSLSGGQKQRVRVARELAGRPGILLLDEPITGLDLPSQEVILEVVASETARGTTVIMTTHHLDEARHCDQVILMATGLVASGRPDDVLTPEMLRRAFGERLLGRHDDHDHPHEMLMLDDHGHDRGSHP